MNINEQEPAILERPMLSEVLEGLGRPQKRLPSKFFYDERGSVLFEAICDLEEYYPTRTEVRIMQDNIHAISDRAGADCVLVELGSGSSRKTRLLLDHLPGLRAYIPVDISRSFLDSVVEELSREYPDLKIHPIAADYTRLFSIPDEYPPRSKKVVYYPGSTIGNFIPRQAREFLGNIAGLVGKDGGLLIGVDLKKDSGIMHAAYNDSQGITAEFNKNMLHHINRKLDADFDLDKFEHKAFYNAEEGRVEMHLVSLAEHTVHIAGNEFRFEEGESVHTENSYKYSIEEFAELTAPHFKVEKAWTDNKDWFGVLYLISK